MSAVLFYAPQCPNCTRFIDTLNRTPAMKSVQLVDVNTLTQQHRQQLTAVPTLIIPGSAPRVGNKAFEWLLQFNGSMEIEDYSGGKGLAYSEYSDVSAPIKFTQGFSPFSP